MPLHLTRAKVVEHVMAAPTPGLGTGAKTSKGAAGNECSLSAVTRAPGYHTVPHVHDSEQINYIADGEIWFFVEDKAYRCRKGDFQRVPRNLVHWAWNRSDSMATVVETHAPGGSDPVDPDIPNRVEAVPRKRPSRGLFDEGETPAQRRGTWSTPVAYDCEIAEDSEPLTTGLYISEEKLPTVRAPQPGKVQGQAEIRGVYGTECTLAEMMWPAGYHSEPYVRDAEAIIHLLEGEIWFLLEDRGFKCEAGDFLRIPRNAIRWEINASNHPARALVEYSPPALDIETIRLSGGATPEGWVALFEDQEQPRLYGNARTYSVTYDGSATEARYALK